MTPQTESPILTRRPAGPFDTERLLRAVYRIQGDRSFEDEDEAAAFYAQFKGRSVDDIQAQVDLGLQDEAQELAYQALAAGTQADVAALARKALELDGECIDAQVALALGESVTLKGQAERLAGIVDRAKAALGSAFLRRHRGRLWGVLEARPYLRARLALAETLEKASRYDEAVAHLEELLKASEPDIQGARYRLARCYLANHDLKALASLLKVYQHEASAFMAWIAVLERVLARAEKDAEKALASARRVNPYFEEFLTGRRESPESLPEYQESGSPEEAAAAFRLLGDAWLANREAMIWLSWRPSSVQAPRGVSR